MKVEPVEQTIDDGTHRLRGVAHPLVLPGQGVPDPGLGAGAVQPDGDITDQPALPGDGDLDPLARNRPGTVGAGSDNAPRRFHRVGQLPILVAGDFGVVPIGGKHIYVALLHRPQH